MCAATMRSASGRGAASVEGEFLPGRRSDSNQRSPHTGRTSCDATAHAADAERRRIRA